jgi:hypothetical protein
MSAKPITFEFNSRKALEAILYILSKKPSVNLYNILKIIFEADKFHLNLVGRPVTGDRIIKMEFGTVPSMVKNYLDMDYGCLVRLGIDSYPFTRTDYQIKKLRDPDLSYFSKSDLKALDKGIEEYINLSFSEVKDKNHLERCWLQGDMNKQIPFEDIITNDEIRSYLKDLNESSLRVVV